MPTYTYGPITDGAITIHEQECSYQMTEKQLVTEIADLKQAHDQCPGYSDERLYQDCLALLEGALIRLKSEIRESAP